MIIITSNPKTHPFSPTLFWHYKNRKSYFVFEHPDYDQNGYHRTYHVDRAGYYHDDYINDGEWVGDCQDYPESEYVYSLYNHVANKFYEDIERFGDDGFMIVKRSEK
jgi:hypothetical protein